MTRADIALVLAKKKCQAANREEHTFDVDAVQKNIAVDSGIWIPGWIFVRNGEIEMAIDEAMHEEVKSGLPKARPVTVERGL